MIPLRCRWGFHAVAEVVRRDETRLSGVCVRCHSRGLLDSQGYLDDTTLTAVPTWVRDGLRLLLSGIVVAVLLWLAWGR